jgi:hypothetical protein
MEYSRLDPITYLTNLNIPNPIKWFDNDTNIPDLDTTYHLTAISKYNMFVYNLIEPKS